MLSFGGNIGLLGFPIEGFLEIVAVQHSTTVFYYILSFGSVVIYYFNVGCAARWYAFKISLGFQQEKSLIYFEPSFSEQNQKRFLELNLNWKDKILKLKWLSAK